MYSVVLESNFTRNRNRAIINYKIYCIFEYVILFLKTAKNPEAHHILHFNLQYNCFRTKYIFSNKYKNKFYIKDGDKLFANRLNSRHSVTSGAEIMSHIFRLLSTRPLLCTIDKVSSFVLLNFLCIFL